MKQNVQVFFFWLFIVYMSCLFVKDILVDSPLIWVYDLKTFMCMVCQYSHDPIHERVKNHLNQVICDIMLCIFFQQAEKCESKADKSHHKSRAVYTLYKIFHLVMYPGLICSTTVFTAQISLWYKTNREVKSSHIRHI